MLILSLLLAIPAIGQTTLSNGKLIVLSGVMTLGNALERISLQSKAACSCASILKDRVVSLKIEGLNSEECIEALAEMYDLKVERKKDGSRRLAKKQFASPRNLIELKAQAPLMWPVDIRDFTRMSVSSKILDFQRLVAEGEVSAMPQSPGDEVKLPPIPQETMEKLVEKEKRALYEKLKPEIDLQKSMPVSSLSEERKKALLSCLTLVMLNSELQLLNSTDLPSWMTRPSSNWLKLEHTQYGDMMTISCLDPATGSWVGITSRVRY